MKKRLVIFSLLIGLCCNGTGTVYATDVENTIPVSSYQGEEELRIDSIENSSVMMFRSSGTLEAEYVSPYVTSVKYQGSYGTCWSFAYMAASEASMIKNGLASADVDLSEWHLAYFLANAVTDPLGGTAGDKLQYYGNYLDIGGNQQFATYRVANWCGVVAEETAPYETVYADASATLSEEVAYSEDVAHLENAYWVSMNDRNLIKQLIKEYGACGASYCHAEQYYNSASLYRTEQEVATYCPDDYATNHGITIVGWDDNYSRDNFGENKPEADGAWYCKNSWGSDWSKDGYFWISYEDVPLSNGAGYFYDYGTSDNYDHNYQYDGGVWGCYYSDCTYEANVYQAKGNESLKAVGFYTRNAKYLCTISIYTDCKEGNPASGTMVTSIDADQLYAGFHTVKLDEAVELKENQTFSIVIQQTTVDGEAPEIMVDSSTASSKYGNISSAEEGQSYIGKKGYWWDISTEKMGSMNCRIKAYTDDVVTQPVTGIELDEQDVTLLAGDTLQLKENVLPWNANVKDVIWSSEDEEIAAVSEEGLVTAISYGETEIICRSVDREEIYAVCKVSVNEKITEIVITGDCAEGNVGETLQLGAETSPSVERTMGIRWESGNEDIASVDASGTVQLLSAGLVNIKCISNDDGGAYTVYYVRVKQPVTDIRLGYSKITLMEGVRQQLAVSILPENATDKSVIWYSDNQQVVSVSDEGLITANQHGEATVFCKSAENEQIYGTCKIIVKSKVASISVQQKSVDLAIGDQTQLTATVTPDLGQTQGIYWISDNKEVAKVDETGKVQALAAGSATIKCIARDGSGVNAVCEVNVSEKTVTYQKGDVFEEPETGATYKVTKTGTSGGTVEYKKVPENVSHITIPASIVMNGITYKVTSIQKDIFKNNRQITSITIGDNITNIPANTFSGCTKLTSVVIGKNVTVIGDKAFYKCTKLSKITIPSKVKKIGKQAFANCKKLKTITIKTSKLTNKNVGSKAFKGIHSKATFKVPKKKLKAYKKLLKAKGAGKKVTIKK